MATSINRADPTPVSVLNMIQGSGATGTYFGWHAVRIPYNATSTANGATNWVNPENGTVMARARLVLTTAGTGTFDMGRSDDGTGNSNGMIDGGTLTAGAHFPGTVLGTAAASATKGGLDNDTWLVGPGSTGTNNSINVTHSDTTTSTAVGALIIEYALIT